MKKIKLIIQIILFGTTSISFGQEDRESLQPRDKIIETNQKKLTVPQITSSAVVHISLLMHISDTKT